MAVRTVSESECALSNLDPNVVFSSQAQTLGLQVFGVDVCGQLLMKRGEITALCHKGTADFLLGVGLGLG